LEFSQFSALINSLLNSPVLRLIDFLSKNALITRRPRKSAALRSSHIALSAPSGAVIHSWSPQGGGYKNHSAAFINAENAIPIVSLNNLLPTMQSAKWPMDF